MNKMDYSLFYQTIRRHLLAYEAQLNYVNSLITGFNYLLFPFLLVWVVLSQGWYTLILNLVILGGGFVLLSLGRSLYNRPRPYETWDIQPLISKDSPGKSLPSRHVFSATAIAMLALSLNLWLGIFMLSLAACLALLRVAGGVHYPSDVVFGYIIGILVGCLLFIL